MPSCNRPPTTKKDSGPPADSTKSPLIPSTASQPTKCASFPKERKNSISDIRFQLSNQPGKGTKQLVLELASPLSLASRYRIFTVEFPRKLNGNHTIIQKEEHWQRIQVFFFPKPLELLQFEARKLLSLGSGDLHRPWSS